MDYLIISASCLFFITSIFHAFKNSYYASIGAGSHSWLNIHYAMVAIFSLFLLIYCLRAPENSYIDLLISAVGVSIIHMFRFVLDGFDDHAVTKKNLVRYVADCGANYIIIAFAIVAAAKKDGLLVPVAFIFSAMMICKEIKYRTIDDFHLRRNGRSSTSQGLGSATDPALSTFHEFSRWLKSYFYVVIGFGLIYLCLALHESSIATLISAQVIKGSQFVNAVVFSLRSATAFIAPGISLDAAFVGVLEFGANIVMLLSFASIAFKTRR